MTTFAVRALRGGKAFRDFGGLFASGRCDKKISRSTESVPPLRDIIDRDAVRRESLVERTDHVPPAMGVQALENFVRVGLPIAHVDHRRSIADSLLGGGEGLHPALALLVV